MHAYRVTFDLSTISFNCGVTITLEAPADVARSYIEQVATNLLRQRFKKGWDAAPPEIVEIQDLGIGTNRKTLPLVKDLF